MRIRRAPMAEFQTLLGITFTKGHQFKKRLRYPETAGQALPTNMILAHLQFLNLKSVMLRNPAKQFPDPLANRPVQHLFPICGRPHQMIAGVIHAMAGSFDGHVTTVPDRCCLRQHAFFIPALPGGAFNGNFS